MKKTKDGLVSLFIALLTIFFITLPSTYMKQFDLKRIILTGKVDFWQMFRFGLFVSVHCVGMCGGIIMIVAVGNKKVIPNNVLYQFARIIAVVTTGFILGITGNLILTNKYVANCIPLFCGIIMLMEGFHILGYFKNIRLLGESSIIKKLTDHATHNPLFMGGLTALLPCGVSRTAQMFALESGSGFRGAILMFGFALGTMPLMFLYGNYGYIFPTKLRRLIESSRGYVILYFGINMLLKVLK